MRTWLGPPAEDRGTVCVGTISVERWRRQPNRTLLFGLHGNQEDYPKPVAPGLGAIVAVSKGQPASVGEHSTLYAGIQVQPLEREKQLRSWYCPCDVQITLLGQKGHDLPRTVRWVLTPQSNEIFFGVLPLADVERDYISDSGTLRVRADLRLHLATPHHAHGHPSILPLGTHGLTFTAMTYAWCQSGISKSESQTAKDPCSENKWWDISRGGLLERPEADGNLGIEEWHLLPVAPGLLPPADELPSAFAQEVIPGLMIASETVMCKLLELHDVGVRTLLELHRAPPHPQQQSGSAIVNLNLPPIGMIIRVLKLRSSGDSVDLVEDPSASYGAALNVQHILDLVDTTLDGVLSGQEEACQVLVFPREALDVEPCVAVVAAVVSRRFKLTFSDAQQYLQTRWDTTIGECWAQWATEDTLPSSPDERRPAPGLALKEFIECYQRCNETQESLQGKFSAWFTSACNAMSSSSISTFSLRDATILRHDLEPAHGVCFRVHDSGWGSASEMFRAIMSVNGKPISSDLITLRVMNSLPKGEILEVPHRLDVGDDVWHLLSLICSGSDDTLHGTSSHSLAFFHGDSDWILDTDGCVYPLKKREFGAPLESWLCTSDISARVFVYMKNRRPKACIPRPLPVAGRTPVGNHVETWHASDSADVLTVRVITEKMLQRVDGGFTGGSCISASTVLSVPHNIGVSKLQDKIHDSLKIPPNKQLLLYVPDRFSKSDVQRLFPIKSPLGSMIQGGSTITLLLMFVTDGDGPLDSEVAPTERRWPLLCRYFDRETLRYSILGIMLIPLADCFLQHLDWLQKRMSLLSSRKVGNVNGSILACYLETSALHLEPLRMDWPLCEQAISSGCCIAFETALCGRLALPPAGTMQGAVAQLHAQLLQQPPSVSMLGCMLFDSDVKAHRSKGRGSVEMDAWSTWQRFIADEIGTICGNVGKDEELRLEMVSASKTGNPVSPAVSTIVFRVLLDMNMSKAARIARGFCHCFAAPHTCRASANRDRFMRYRPRELFVTAGTFGGGMRTSWHSVAHSSGSSIMPSQPQRSGRVSQTSALPTPLLAALPKQIAFGKMQLVEVFPSDVQLSAGLGIRTEVGMCTTTHDGAEDQAAGRAERHAAALLVEEAQSLGVPDNTSKRSRRKALMANGHASSSKESVSSETQGSILTGESAGVALTRAMDQICGDSKDDAGGLSSEAVRDSPRTLVAHVPQVAHNLQPDFVSSDVSATLGSSATVGGNGAVDGNTVSVASFGAEDNRIEALGSNGSGSGIACLQPRPECQQYVANGICFDGARCPFAHSTGLQLVRSEPCPFKTENRDRCPLRFLCVFSHGEAERQNPPYVRARGGDRSVASTPGGARTRGHSPAGLADESAQNFLRKAMRSTSDQLVALLAQAKVLHLNEEIQGVERQLLPLFLLRRQAQSREARSSAMSRSSSCDSFFEEPPGRDATKLVLAPSLTPGEATQPSTPRSLVHTPGARPSLSNIAPHGHWVELEASEAAEEPASDIVGETAENAILPAVAPQLPIVSWHEPTFEATGGATNPCSPSTHWSDDHALDPPRAVEHLRVCEPLPLRGLSITGFVEQAPVAGTGAGREEAEQHLPPRLIRPPRPERRIIGAQASVPGAGIMWHTSPFNISRTPNIRTPASHCSPARSPTSFSGYCSPNTGLPSGVASPNQRRSQSGYSSPSADRAHLGPTFFAGTSTAQSGSLMRRLMSLREAREEKEDDEKMSSEDGTESDGAEETNLLEFLLQHAQSAPLGRTSKDPQYLRLDLNSEFLTYSRRGLTPSRHAPCLNAFLQAFLLCSPLMHLFAQLSRHTLTKQRPAYAYLVHITFQFFGPTAPTIGSSPPVGTVGLAMLPPFDACSCFEPLLRRFERWKAVAQLPGSGSTDTLVRFVHFVLGQLHDECKWPTLSPIAGHYEDSPINRIFGGLLRTGRETQRTSLDSNSFMDPENSEVEPFLVLRLEIHTPESAATVDEAIQQLLRPTHAHFLRLPPFLLIHLQRFRTVDGLPTKISRHCRIDMRLMLEEAASCMLRSVSYELCSGICHYGEVPDSGSYKALARDSGTSDWYVFDDTAVRQKHAEELGAVLQCEGYHACFLMYRREDTKTINIRPHAV